MIRLQDVITICLPDSLWRNLNNFTYVCTNCRQSWDDPWTQDAVLEIKRHFGLAPYQVIYNQGGEWNNGGITWKSGS